MTRCADCALWLTGRKLVFAGSERLIVTAPDGKGLCRGPLDGAPVPPDFGCVAFQAAASDDAHLEIHDFRPKEAHEVWEMIDCPDCGGKGSIGGEPDHDGVVSSSACHRCCGTGNVRRYGDGWEGEERTRLHPFEVERIRREKELELRKVAEEQIAALDRVEAPPELTRGSTNLRF